MGIKRILAVSAVLLGVVAGPISAAHAGENHHSHGHGRIEHITLLSSDPTTTDVIAIGRGPIHARGTDQFVSDTEDLITFPAGTLTVHHHVTKSHDTSDPTTCYFSHRERGKYTITSGTGAYAAIHGHGTYRLVVTTVGCDPNAAPDFFTLRVDAKGPLSLASTS